MIAIVSSSIKDGGILLIRYGLWDRPMLPDDELIPLNADCTWKVPDSCQTAKALINKEGAPTCLFNRLRGHIAFARKNGQDMLYFRPKYALNHTLGCESGREFFEGRCFAHMLKDVLATIDNEIACLEQAKVLLSVSGAVVAKLKPGRPAKVATVVTPKVQKARKRSKMSAEGRERIRQAQIKRWAALRSASKANMNETVGQLPKAMK